MVPSGVRLPVAWSRRSSTAGLIKSTVLSRLWSGTGRPPNLSEPAVNAPPAPTAALPTDTVGHDRNGGFLHQHRLSLIDLTQVGTFDGIVASLVLSVSIDFPTDAGSFGNQ
jgi:hypothetical protein